MSAARQISAPVESLVSRLDAKRSGKGWMAKCPAHADRKPSLSVSEGNDGRVLLKCHAGCSTQEVLAAAGLTASDLFPSNGRNGNIVGCRTHLRERTTRQTPQFDWKSCVAAFTKRDQEQFAEWRGYSDIFVSWLHERALVGLYNGGFAFPVHEAGKVVAAHYRTEDGSWRYAPAGSKTQPYVIGDLSAALEVHAHESQWDALAGCDKLGWHEKAGVAVIATRGASNGGCVAPLVPASATVYLWPQNDEPGKKWADDITTNSKAMVRRVTTPPPYKDLNSWVWEGGATAADLRGAMQNGEVHTREPRIRFYSPAALRDFVPDEGVVLVGDCQTCAAKCLWLAANRVLERAGRQLRLQSPGQRGAVGSDSRCTGNFGQWLSRRRTGVIAYSRNSLHSTATKSRIGFGSASRLRLG